MTSTRTRRSETCSPFARLVGTRVVDRGPLRATLEARYELRIPEGLAADPDDALARRTRRAGRAVTLPISVHFGVDAAARFVRVRVTGANRARDHRLRIVFRTGLTDARVFADAAFGPVERAPLVVPPADAVAERPPATAPLHRYVSLSGARPSSADATGVGCAVGVFSDGLAEYEATPDGSVAVTLLRSVGQLSRADLPERPGHAGWPASTPEAQVQGGFTAGFALAVHGARGVGERGSVEQIADDVLLPLAGETIRPALHALDTPASFELTEGFAFGAAKPAERGDGWVVLRATNLADQRAPGAWRIVAPGDYAVQEAVRSRLDESPGDALDVERDGNAAVVRFDADARETVTVLVR